MTILDRSFIIRKAIMADVPALAALHVATFIETHGSNHAPSFETRKWQWENIFLEKNNDWFILVIEKENEGLIGFAKGQMYLHIEHSEFAGELNKIYVLKKYQKLGLGRKLICTVANEFIRLGVNSMLLFGDARNISNLFYEKMGAEKLYALNGEFHGGYGWRDLARLSNNFRNV